MRAMVLTQFGGPESFEEREWETPQPGSTEVLVRVHATSVNPVDYKIRQSGSWAGVEPPAIIGYDVAGVIDKVGEAVTEFQPGDEVFYTGEIFGAQGCYAEYHVADASIVARKPSNLAFQEAAALPLAGGTAWDALVTRGLIEPGETVLIHGAGGVGSVGIQIAAIAGTRVLVVCSDYMTEIVRVLGGEPINYKTTDFTNAVNELTGGEGVDLVFDTVGGDIMTRSMTVVKPHGRMVGIVGTDTGFRGANPLNITVQFLFLERERWKLDKLRTLTERDQLIPVIDSVMDLSEVSAAHKKLEQGGVKGKIVLSITS